MGGKPLIGAADLLEDLEAGRGANLPDVIEQIYRCKGWPRRQHICIQKFTKRDSPIKFSLTYNVMPESDNQIYETIEQRLGNKGFSTNVPPLEAWGVFSRAIVDTNTPEEVEEFIKIVKSCFGTTEDEFYRYSLGTQYLEIGDILVYIALAILSFLLFIVLLG